MAAGSCTAVVSPNSVQTQTDTNFSFSVTNTGDGTVNFVKIVSPSSNFNMQNYGVPGWDVNANNTFADLTGGTVTAGSTFNFNYHATSGSIEVGSANWQVSTNDGSGEVNCTGTLGTAISGVADRTAPVITGDIVISGISGSSVTISWVTDENSSSVVEYGTSYDYGSISEDSTMVTSHSVTISDLLVNTTYYFMLTSSDAAGNSVMYDGDPFTTAAVNASVGTTLVVTVNTTNTVTVTDTVTTTTIITPTPTPTPIPDRTGPVVTIEGDLSDVYEQSPTVAGKATDKSRVTKLEYSTDGGDNWLPIDNIESPNETITKFEFTPDIFDDGNYTLVVRGQDSLDNLALSKKYDLVIDRLPPLVGANLISLGPLVLTPNQNGYIITTTGISQKLNLSAIGGPTSIDLLINSIKNAFNFSLDTNLWSTNFSFDQPGIYQLVTSAIDGALNQTERALNQIMVIEPGKITTQDDQAIEGATITLYYLDTYSNTWVVWEAGSFEQTNPQTTEEDGSYQLFLPPGTYYFKITADSFKTITSNIFSLSIPTPINTVFKMSPATGFKFGPISFNLPDLSPVKTVVEINLPTANISQNELVNKEAPLFTLPSTNGQFDLRSLRGRPSVVSFVSSWSPPSLEQIAVLEKLYASGEDNLVLVSSQQTFSTISIFHQRGQYQIPIVIDPDGTLVEPYQLNNLPTNYFVDRKGIVQYMATGVLNLEEIEDILKQI